jgi:hypothetical protein
VTDLTYERLPSPMRLSALSSFPENARIGEVRAMARWIHEQLEARARSTDPDTSHEAARSIGSLRLNEVREAILALLRVRPLADWMLVEFYSMDASLPKQSPQSIRSRRADLVRMGLIVEDGTAPHPETGRRHTLWRATPAGASGHC